MLQAIEKVISDFKKATENAVIRIISHYDTDGITSTAILTKALQREDKKFSIKVVKQLDKEFIGELKKEAEKKPNQVFVFLDLGSSHLDSIRQIPSKTFVFDHHETDGSKYSIESENLKFVNPKLFNEEVSAAGLTYLFAKALNPENKDTASLAVIGMVGDMLEQSISKINNQIIKDASELVIKRGPLIFSATRPINKALEFSSSIFIPGVTGSSNGSLKLLREIGIKLENGKYPSLIELSQEEVSRLITEIMLKRVQLNDGMDKEGNIIGNIYLLKFFNRLEDVRELSALINACSRLGHSDVALSFCLGDYNAKIRAEDIYNRYKHEILHGLKWIETQRKIEGKGYVIINAKGNIRDSIIGTVTSIIASSFIYKEGTIIVGMAYQDSKIKISARIAGSNSRGINLQKLMSKVAKRVGGESGGHMRAAGCIIPFEKEEFFLETLRNELEIEDIKIKI
jgi:RecJ-like exonuclease